MKNCLAMLFPEIAAEWHPTKNSGLMPNMIVAGSHTVVRWQCKKGHEWKTSIKHRTQRKQNCPYCSGKKTCIDNCLATLSPKISAEWHPTKNGDLTPFDVVSGSNKKVWWKCEKGHEWEAVINNRKITNCPCCSGHKSHSGNCLETNNSTFIAQWNIIKNGSLTPCDVTPNSNKKVWWKCEKGHEWKSTIHHRQEGKSCPYCTNRKVCVDNCLAILYPKIIAEWHPTKNGDLTPFDLTKSSNKKVWWKCEKGHEWTASPNGRTFKERNCPYCTNQKVCNENCLATLCPELSTEWHPTKNGNLTPSDIISGSGKKVWWQCENGHEWKISAASRKKTNCPVCNESKGEKTVAETLVLFNVKFKRQYKFKSCKYKRQLPFDFIIKTINGIKVIEYQGEQHFMPIKIFGGEAELNIRKKRDVIKKEWCEKRKIPLLAIPYWEFNNIENLLKDFISM